MSRLVLKDVIIGDGEHRRATAGDIDTLRRSGLATKGVISVDGEGALVPSSTS